MCCMFLRAWKSVDCAFENNGREIKCWILKKYLFDTSITQVFCYGVEVKGGSIHKSTWKEFPMKFLLNQATIAVDALS